MEFATKRSFMVSEEPITTGMVLAPIFLSPLTSIKSKRTVFIKLFVKKKMNIKIIIIKFIFPSTIGRNVFPIVQLRATIMLLTGNMSFNRGIRG